MEEYLGSELSVIDDIVASADSEQIAGDMINECIRLMTAMVKVKVNRFAPSDYERVNVGATIRKFVNEPDMSG